MTEQTVTEQTQTEQTQTEQTHADNGAEPGQQAEEQAGHQRGRAAVSSGNPRITVAFPFGRIDIREPSEPLRELASLVEQLAEQAVTLAKHAAPEEVAEADRLAAQAALLARRLGSA